MNDALTINTQLIEKNKLSKCWGMFYLPLYLFLSLLNIYRYNLTISSIKNSHICHVDIENEKKIWIKIHSCYIKPTNDLTRWDKVECPVGGGRGQLMDTDWYRDLKYGGV